ncbi:hypothetical protein [Sporolactobacillus terrae]|uniref:Uncharacterized protein n=1 Tax=Sporolactobacillus terrae TaxID=269673 RepID=A0A5K7WT42_9BACL|nr:hypothetical protein [Sporolactobacillus terrae]BBN97472.1 hypothetical protein St703_01770 [Sporolactobacillus terrae]
MKLGQTVKIKAHLVRQSTAWFDPKKDDGEGLTQIVRSRQEKSEKGVVCGKRKVLLSRRLESFPDMALGPDLGAYETESVHSEVTDQKFSNVILIATNQSTLRYVLPDDVVEQEGEING